MSKRKPATPPALPVPDSPSRDAPLPTLASCRKRIDEIDTELIALLDARARVARRVGEIKRDAAQDPFDAGRHIEKLNAIASRGAGDFPVTGLRLVFGEVLSACLALQARQTVGYLGPEATFSYIAAVRAFGRSVDFKPFQSIPEIFTAVEKEWIHYGIVPVENSTGGVIHTTLDALMSSSLSICAEIHIPVRHNLMCRGTLAGIKKIATHPQILSQCRNWLRANLPTVALSETASSAEGARLAVKNKTVATIGPEMAAKIYQLPILARNIEDQQDNVTRFLIIGHQSPAPSGRDKTSIMFSIKDEPGVLKKILTPFSDLGLNLSKIESRPSRRRAWDYIFFIDVNGHMNDAGIQRALDAMRPHTTFIRVLGSYPMDDYEGR